MVSANNDSSQPQKKSLFAWVLCSSCLTCALALSNLGMILPTVVGRCSILLMSTAHISLATAPCLLPQYVQ